MGQYALGPLPITSDAAKRLTSQEHCLPCPRQGCLMLSDAVPLIVPWLLFCLTDAIRPTIILLVSSRERSWMLGICGNEPRDPLTRNHRGWGIPYALLSKQGMQRVRRELSLGFCTVRNQPMSLWLGVERPMCFNRIDLNDTLWG